MQLEVGRKRMKMDCDQSLTGGQRAELANLIGEFLGERTIWGGVEKAGRSRWPSVKDGFMRIKGKM